MAVASQVVTMKVNQKQQKKTTNPYLAHKVTCALVIVHCMLFQILSTTALTPILIDHVAWHNTKPQNLSSHVVAIVYRLEGVWITARTLLTTRVLWDRRKALAATAPSTSCGQRGTSRGGTKCALRRPKEPCSLKWATTPKKNPRPPVHPSTVLSCIAKFVSSSSL